MEYKGSNLEKDVFPELAKRDFLYGYLSSKEYLHVAKKDDIKMVEKKLKEF